MPPLTLQEEGLTKGTSCPSHCNRLGGEPIIFTSLISAIRKIQPKIDFDKGNQRTIYEALSFYLMRAQDLSLTTLQSKKKKKA